MALPPGWTYLGCFLCPNISAADDKPTLNYSDAALAYDPADNTLFISGFMLEGRVGKISIPTPSLSTNKASLPRATLIQAMNNCFPRLQSQPFNDPRVGGLLVEGGKLYGSVYSDYENRAQFAQSHYKYAGTTVSGSVTGLSAVGPLSQAGVRLDVVGGYMTSIPTALRGEFGGPCLTGAAALNIISGTSLGPAVSVFDPATIGTSPYAPATPLVYYPIDHALDSWSASNTVLFNGTTQIKGVMVEPDGDVLFWGSQGTGPWNYKTNYDVRGWDCQADPYRYQFWHYTKADLLAVKNGTKLAWEPRPTIYDVVLNHQNGAAFAGGMAHDTVNGKVYVAAVKTDGSMPMIHVFQVSSAPPPDTTAPVISNIAHTTTENTATITWTTDEASDTRVEYGPTVSYGTVQVDNVDTTAHSATLTGLTPSTTYNYRVKSWDAANNSVTSANRTLTTADPPNPCAAVIAERDALAVQLAATEQLVASQVAQITSLQSQVNVLNATNAALTNSATVLTLERDAALAKIADGLNEVNQAKAALE